jgi:hypothetical protein
VIIAEFARNDSFISSLHSVNPCIYVGETKYYSLKTEWGTSCDDIYGINKMVKVKQVSRDFLNKYMQEYTYNEMIVQEGSFYFDKEAKRIFVHIEHDYNPLVATLDYGYAFGVCENELTYVDDYEYLPLISGAPDVNRETDYVNSNQPTGSTGSLSLINMEYKNSDGVIEGRLDFLINESIYGNDVFIYRLEYGILIPLSYMYVEDISYGEEEIEIDLQDRRFS